MSTKNINPNEKELGPTVIEKTMKPSGEIQLTTYIKGKFLGKGGFAKVYELVSSDTNQQYACKFIPKDRISKHHIKQKLMSEIKIHRCLRHENVVQFCHFFEDDEQIYILLEYCRNNSLTEVLRRRKRLTEIEAQSYLLSMIHALQYLHGHRVIHRDIKLANIFLNDKMEVKLGDFGLATKLEFDGERKRTICGTPNYIAPEILDGKNGHSYECDIWSFGVLMYTMLVGKPPYETKDVKTTYRRIKMNLYNFPENVEISKEAKALISSILVVDYTQRPTLDDILAHEFFNKNPIPKALPQSVLAIPPTPGYLQKFEAMRIVGLTRASSHENKLEPKSPSPLRLRTSSKDTKPLAESKKDMQKSAYFGDDKEGPSLWVTQWIDYSKKYGIGYLFSNNCIGAVFNDNTKIIADPQFTFFQYISNIKTGEKVSYFKIGEYPSELFKKVMIVQLFKKQLVFEEKEGNEVKKPFTYLKKWLITPHAFIFRISNKIIQICFRDSTELILCSETKHVTYVNKEKHTCSYNLMDAMDCGCKEMTKRLKYSREVLMKMLKTDN